MHVPNVVLLHEFRAAPLVCHWLRLALRFWNQMVQNKHWVLHAALLSDIGLAKSGSKECWAGKVITILNTFGVKYDLSDPIDSICKVVDVEKVVEALKLQVFQSLSYTFVDPRTCPSSGAKHSMYMRWFAHTDNGNFHVHIKSTGIPSGKHRDLMRFRLGCTKNAVNEGRMQNHNTKKPRSERLCAYCTMEQAEDELHMVFDCSVYNGIRSSRRFLSLFKDVDTGDMRTFFNNQYQQPLLADFVRAIMVARKQHIAALLINLLQ